MPNDLTVLEVLGLAIQSEEEAAKFYGDLSRRIANELARAKYESLAREEISHRELLTKLYQRSSGEGRPPRVPGSPALAEGGGIPVETESIEKLLEIAIEREVKAHQFYLEMAPRMAEANSRRLIEYLADIERGHEQMLRGELAAYRRDKHWYAEKPDIQLVG